MIKFFRHIRKSLLEQDKMGKYFKYAIGEIILVVIGILIALQINNWNEGRKSQLKSHNYLKRLKVDLDVVLEDVKESLDATDRKYQQALTVLEALEKKELQPEKQKMFERHLKEYFQFEITIQNTTAYNEMLSSGDLGLIENEWLRTAFSDLSEVRDFIMEVNQSNHNAYKNDMNIFQKYVRYQIKNKDTDSRNIKVKYDFDGMANDDLFINQMSNQAYTWGGVLRMYKGFYKRVNIVKDSISNELKKYD